MNTNIESSPLISTSENSLPLWPSTFTEKLDEGLRKRMEDMVTPFLLGLRTTSRAVGVPTPVNTVSKLTVSVENDRRASGEVVKSSDMHDEMIKPKRATKVNKR